MGIVQRQSIKHSIITYTSVVLGMVNVLFIYTNFLTTEELGLYSFLVATASLFLPFVVLGMSLTTTKFFPVFKNKENGNNGLLFITLSIPLLGYFLFILLSYYNYDKIIRLYENNPNFGLFQEYFPYIFIFLFILLLNTLLTNYISNFKRIVIPNVLNYLWIKIGIPISAILYGIGFLNFSGFVHSCVITYTISLIGLISYLCYLGELNIKPNLKFIREKNLGKEMATYSFYGILSGVGFALATQIDIYMTGTLLDLDKTGVYRIAMLIGGVVGIPANSLLAILIPLVSEKWNNNDLKEINILYKKSSIISVLIGLFIFILIWASINELFKIIPNGEDYQLGKNAILILGLAKLLDASTSINSPIINYSKYYRFNVFMVLLLAFMNVFFNILFIEVFGLGLVGVATATFSSLAIYNITKTLFIWMKYKMQPFSLGTIKAIFIALFCYLVSCIIPVTDFPVLNLIVKSLFISIIFVFLTIKMKVSLDINDFIFSFLNKIFKRNTN